MKQKLTIHNLAFFLFIIMIGIFVANSNPVQAEEDAVTHNNYLNIATFDSRPLSVDRLIYMALRDVECQSSFTSLNIQTALDSTNAGESDGVITFIPDIEKDYPNLRKIPVPLEQIGIVALVRKDDNLHIGNWEDLSRLKVGVLSQRPYISSKIPKDGTTITKENNEQVFEGLLQGEYDVAIITQRLHETIQLPNEIKRVGELESHHEYLYVNQTKESLVPKLTEAIECVFQDGRGNKVLSDVPIPELNQKRTILHIISSNKDITREERFNSVLKETFKNDDSIEWYTVELSSKRFSRDPNRLAYFANLLRQDCVSRNVAAIVVSGEEALDFIQDYYNVLFHSVPVLFYGINKEMETVIQQFDPYITGIIENLSVYDTVNAALDIFPEAKSLYVINDYTLEGRYYKEEIEKQLAPLEDRIHIEYNENLDRYALLKRINGLSEDSLVFVGTYFSDLNGQYFSQNEMMRLLKENCGVPVFSLFSTDLPYHAIGGKCLDYEKYGEVISDMLTRLLEGENVEDISIIYDSEGYNRWVFDKNEMDEWNIKEKDLPKNALILNSSPSIWESNPEFATSIILLFVISIIIIVSVNIFMNKYRRQRENLHMAEELLLKDVKIKEVKERLESIMNTAPVAYVLTLDGIVFEANDYMKNHVGITTGNDMRNFYTYPSERKEILRLVAEQKQVMNRIVRYNMVNGESHRFLSNFTAIEYEKQQALILWAMDIEGSERKKDQLLIARQNLQTVLDTLPVAVRIINIENETILYANNVCMEMFGFDSLDKDGDERRLVDFLPEIQPNGTYTVEILNRNKHSKEPISYEIVSKKEDGTLFDTLITAYVIDFYGQTSLLGIIKDLTAEKEYERQLISVAEKEKEANQLKSSFLVNMSHEIRTPMNAIIGLTEIELRKNHSRETRDVYKKISNSAKNLLQIINDILDLSKIEADKMELMVDEFELEDVLSSALLVVTPRLDEKDVELMLDASLDLPHFLMGDKTRLWQILKNFLDNAAKYTEYGKIVLSAYVNEEESNKETITINFIIKDTGIGIEEEQLQKAFIPYEQFYNEAQKKYKGTGLGMAISKQLCEIMGGTLHIESKLGEGTSIHVTIPFQRSHNDETLVQFIKTPCLSDKNILIVDDDERSLEVVTTLLSKGGVNSVLACNGSEVMDVLTDQLEGEDGFDVILLDYKVSGFDTLETVKKVKGLIPYAKVVLMATTYQKQLIVNDLTDGVVNGMVEKPFIPSQLMMDLCEILDYAPQNTKQVQKTLTQFKDARVLLCEDNLINQEVAVGMMEEFGITPTVADNGKQALKIMEGEQDFDLIFMDLQMPIMDGYQTTRKIREERKYERIPIISLTADAMTEVVNKCLEVGMVDHLAKPIEFEGLHKVLLKWLPKEKQVKL